MTTLNALATARLSFARRRPPGRYHVDLLVWSHSYDHPDVARRNALVTGVFLAQPAPNAGYAIANQSITDRYGVDQTSLWIETLGVEAGFTGYSEYDTAGACGGTLPHVFWTGHTGIYDERCLADPTCDAMRLQTYRIGAAQLIAYNYLLGPVTFSFDVTLASPPSAVRITMGQIGGNGGNPAQRTATLPDEEFIIRFP